MAIRFSGSQVRNRILFENPWWETNSIDSFYLNMSEREYCKLFYPLVTEKKIKRAVVLMGPRRVGKTVMLYHTIESLIKSKIPAKNICYFSIETPLYNGIFLEELFQLYLDIAKKTINDDLYIFFDEIQYLKDWEIHLKSLVDSFHNIKFIVSGSAAAALKLKSIESGAGRFTEFILPPLTFHEFLSLTNRDDNILKKTKSVEIEGVIKTFNEYSTTNIKLLNNEFIKYINFGGYPELSLSKEIQTDPGRYIRNDIIDKVLMRDLPSLYGISDIQELNSLFTYIAYNTGSEMSLDTLSQNSGVAKNTIKKYLTYLEAAFLIKVIHRIDNNAKKFKRANYFKVYLTNPSIRSALFSPITENDNLIGSMVETAIFSQWQHSQNSLLFYARWNKGEIDIVSLHDNQKPFWVVEVKWSNRFAENIGENKNVVDFCRNHNVNDLTITTIDIEKKELYNAKEIKFIPSSLYCYMVGRNLVEGKTNLKT